MYALLIVILLASGIGILSNGVRRQRKWEIGLGIVVLVGTPTFFGLLSLWGEMLWFDALGYGDRFWTALSTQVGLAIAAGAMGAVTVWLLTSTILSLTLDQLNRVGVGRPETAATPGDAAVDTIQR